MPTARPTGTSVRGSAARDGAAKEFAPENVITAAASTDAQTRLTFFVFLFFSAPDAVPPGAIIISAISTSIHPLDSCRFRAGLCILCPARRAFV
jgi:hypothetical protein